MTDGPAAVAFIGLGMMGLPMATRLVHAGFDPRGCDPSEKARQAFAACGGKVFETARQAAVGADIVITMLPDSAVVREALLGEQGAVPALRPGSLIIDMSSSAPLETRVLCDELVALGIAMIDAPVSGGVRRAAEGSLAIMAGGEARHIERARPLLDAMGASVIEAGSIGAGHAAKALNNFVSAAGLLAACEALIVGEAFGIAPETLVDVLNVSTGRNNATEVKLKPFVLSGSFASGFAMKLMAKDLATAAQLAASLDSGVDGPARAARLWTQASAQLGGGADHTEIYRYLSGAEGAG